jgi:hypothetical protein
MLASSKNRLEDFQNLWRGGGFVVRRRDLEAVEDLDSNMAMISPVGEYAESKISGAHRGRKVGRGSRTAQKAPISFTSTSQQQTSCGWPSWPWDGSGKITLATR